MEQKRRCIEGYEVDGVRITGDHYFYLNFWKMKGKNNKHKSISRLDKDNNRKGLISPKFTQLDYEFFHAVEEAKKQKKHLTIAKRRQCGFSEKASALAGKEFCFYPYSQTIIVAGELSYSEETMKNVHRGLNSLVDTEFYKRMSPSGLDFAMARFKLPKEKNWRGYMSELHCMTANNNSQVTIGKTPSLIIFEEAGKFPNLIDTFNYVRPALEAEGEVTGFALIFGTGGEMGKGADQLMTMFYNPSTYNMMEYEDVYSETYDPEDGDRKKVGYFVPAWQYLKIDENGNNLYKESMDYLLAKRELAKKSPDQKTYFNEITQFPIYTEECFLISDGTFFPSAKLNRKLAEIRRSKSLSTRYKRGDLFWVKNGNQIVGVKFEEMDNGPVLIFEEPEKDSQGNVYQDLYFAGTDSYDRDTAADSKSLGSCSIVKGFLNSNTTSRKFVARVTYRPDTSEEFYEKTAQLCFYYGQCQNLIEYSNLLILKYYRDSGLEYLLKERPEIAYSNVKVSKMQNKWGIDPATKFEWLKIYKDYVENNWDSLEDEEQVIRLLKYRLDKDYNCDITISGALAILHMEDNKDIEVREYSKENLSKFKIGFKFENGKFARKYN